VGYQIDNGKLWRITNGRSIRARARVECISQTEAIELAKLEHGNNGHWGRDLVKLKMLDKIWSPRLDQSIVNAILQCPQCKNFGSSHLHSLMYPITRRHPFELLVADYLSLPKGKGGFHNVLLIMDTFSQYVWGFKLKVHSTAKTTIDGMKTIAHTFRAPETLMTDGGSHFKNGDVRAWCEANEVKHQIVAAYAPWVNGLVENANGKLLGRLKRLCSPGLGEDEYQEVKPDDIGKAWPDHFDTTIRQLNERIIPAFQFSPKELLLGIVVNTTPTPTAAAVTAPQAIQVNVQLAYVDQQRLDAADKAAQHAIARKAIFDRRVLRSKAGEVVFKTGELVQVYDNALDNTLSTARKLLPRWSALKHIANQVGNSYRLTTLEGGPLNGLIHARRLRRFTPREGTALAETQQLEAEGQGNTSEREGDTEDEEDIRSETDEEEQEIEEPEEEASANPEARIQKGGHM
jgi:transposase InsO family protein